MEPLEGPKKMSGTTCSRCSSSWGFSRLFSTQLKAATESCRQERACVWLAPCWLPCAAAAATPSRRCPPRWGPPPAPLVSHWRAAAAVEPLQHCQRCSALGSEVAPFAAPPISLPGCLPAQAAGYAPPAELPGGRLGAESLSGPQRV